MSVCAVSGRRVFPEVSVLLCSPRYASVSNWLALIRGGCYLALSREAARQGLGCLEMNKNTLRMPNTTLKHFTARYKHDISLHSTKIHRDVQESTASQEVMTSRVKRAQWRRGRVDLPATQNKITGINPTHCAMWIVVIHSSVWYSFMYVRGTKERQKFCRCVYSRR